MARLVRQPHRWARLLLPLIFICAGGCALPVGEFSAAPLLDYSKSDRGELRVIVRPLVSYHRQSEDSREWTSLYPLFRSDTDGSEYRAWLLPVYYRTIHEKENGDLDDDSIFLTAFWGNDTGTTPTGGSYFMLFPFGGSLKGLFAQERIDMALFPLYMRVKNDSERPTKRSSHHVLWPFFNYVSGDLDSGFRLWPFYSHYESTNERGQKRFDHTSILWPLFVVNDDALDSERPVKTRMFFPFYGSTRSRTVERTAVLWPFFQYKNDMGRGTQSITVFPATVGWGNNLEQVDLWPLFGYRRTENHLRQSLLWLLQRYERSETRGIINEDYWFLPLYRHHRRTDTAAQETSTYSRFWPLYSYREGTDGSVRFNSFDLFPFQDPERFEPLWARLWRLYRYTDMGDRGSRWDVLWGLFSGEKLQEASRLSLFGGLFVRERDEEGIHWRVLYFLNI